jgi:hypothetical protein
MLGAVVEAVGYPVVVAAFLAGMLNTSFFILFLTVAVAWGVVISFTAVALADSSYQRYSNRGALGQLLAASALENFGYRQLHAFWRVKGMIKYAFGRRPTEWGEMKREGFETGDTRQR